MANKNKGRGFLTPLLGPKQFRKESRAAAKLEFGPIFGQLRGEQRASNYRQNKEIPAWYDQYRARLNELQGGSQAAYDQAYERGRNLAETSGGVDSATFDSLNSEAAKSAALRGAGYDGSSAAAGSQASRLRQGLQALYGQNQQLEGANQQAYFNKRNLLSYLDQGEANKREFSRGQDISSKLLEAKGKRGAFLTDYRRQAREADRAYKNELRATSIDANYKKGLLAQQAANNSGSSGSSGSSSKPDPAGSDDWKNALWTLKAHLMDTGKTSIGKNAAIAYLIEKEGFSVPAAKRAYQTWYDRNIAGPPRPKGV
jgi:hypothetical protein